MKVSQIHVFRVKPDEELVQSITQYCESEHITSAVVTGIIGSLRSVKLGFLKELPGRYETEDFQGPLEIVCAQGTVAICQGEFAAEVALAELDQQIKRRSDDYTGLKELQE